LIGPILGAFDCGILVIGTRRINGDIDLLRPTFCFLPTLRFFGLLYPNQVIEDAHEVLVERPGTSGKRAD
jgi:hypothetical protein